MTSTTTLEPQTFSAENRNDFLSSAQREIRIGSAIWVEREKPRRRGRMDPAFLILADITRLIGHRFAGPVDTDDDETIFEVALPFLNALGDRKGNQWDPWKWAEQYTPRLVSDPAWMFEAIARAGRYRLTVDEIAQVLHITPQDAVRCNFRSLVDCTRNSDVRAEERKARDRGRKDAQRREGGRLTREEYRAQAEAKRQEAEALGVSIRTLERRREKARKATSSAA